MERSAIPSPQATDSLQEQFRISDNDDHDHHNVVDEQSKLSDDDDHQDDVVDEQFRISMDDDGHDDDDGEQFKMSDDMPFAISDD